MGWNYRDVDVCVTDPRAKTAGHIDISPKSCVTRNAGYRFSLDIGTDSQPLKVKRGNRRFPQYNFVESLIALGKIPKAVYSLYRSLVSCEEFPIARDGTLAKLMDIDMECFIARGQRLSKIRGVAPDKCTDFMKRFGRLLLSSFL